jgi:outer membrane protein assembly factor BamB
MQIPFKIKRNSIVLAIVLLAIAPDHIFAQNWPQYGGPNANWISTGTSINTNWSMNTPTIKWTFPLHDNGWASASIVDGTVYIVDYGNGTDILRAIDLKTGVQRWESPCTNDNQAGPGTRSCPVYDNGKLYVFSLSCRAYCFEAATGKIIWSRNLKEEYSGRAPDFGFTSSPLVDGNQVIYLPGGSGASVVALDKLTGNTIWKSGVDRTGHATPVLATINGVKQYVIFNGFGVTGIRTDNGQSLWRHEWVTQHSCNSIQPIVIGNTVFIASGYGIGCALLGIGENWKVTEIWKNKELLGRTANPILYQDHLYCTDETDRLVCLDLKTRMNVWGEHGFGARIGVAWKEGFSCGSGGIILVDGTLIVVSESTKSIVAVKPTPEGYQELGRLKMPLEGFDLFTTPSFSNGKLIVRDKKNLYCVDLSQ